MMEIKLAFGKQQIPVKLPDNRIIDIINGKETSALTNVSAAVAEAMRNPIGAKPLAAIVRPGQRITIVASDITRQWVRSDLMLPSILDELNSAGIPDRDISVLVALGGHRGHTRSEHLAAYGSTVVSRVKITESTARQEQDFILVGTTSRGTPVKINRLAAEADRLVLTGGVTYHSMAGFGGGRKAILPGISAYSTIQANHRFCLDPVPGQGINSLCGCGCLDRNEMQQDMTEAARLVNPAFLVNTVLNPEGDVARVVAGDWFEAWREGCRSVEKIFGVTVGEQADIVIVSAGGYPKDINFYQAGKAVENAALAVRPGGVIIALMECPEVAEPPDFSGWFDYHDLSEREMLLRRDFTVPGFVALKMGLIARSTPVIIVTLPENEAFFVNAGMRTAPTVEIALAQAEKLLGSGCKISVWPHAANTVPLYQNR